MVHELPLELVRPDPKQEEKFWSKVSKNETCWLWQGAKTKDGYGQFWCLDRNVLAHRFAYDIRKGPIPRGSLVMQECKIRLCVNPDHLYLNTSDHRFWLKVNKAGPIPQHCPELGPCWLWTAGISSSGYPQYAVKGQMYQAHRIAYELIKGKIPGGLEVDHLCRNRACVNPSHLEAVTGKVNILRSEGVTARHARKTECPKHDIPYTIHSYGRRCSQCHKETRKRYEQKKKDRR